jgi:hypothetical protein
MNVDQSRRDMTWAVKLANQGYRADQIARELSRTPSGKRPAGSTKYQRILETRGPEDATKYAARTAEKAVTFVATNPKIMDRSAAAVRLVEIESAAESLPWLVYCGPQARRALEATLLVAWRVGSLNFGLSLREWAETAGLEFESIRTARDVLVREGWLRRNPNDRSGRTSRFAIATPSHIHSHGRDMNVGLHNDRVWLAHDAFREPALGSDGWAVLRGVSAVPIPRDSVQNKIALDPDELWEHLLKLERAHVLVVGDNSVRRASEDLVPLLDEIARESGTMGDLLRLRQKHIGERSAWHRRGDVNVGAVMPMRGTIPSRAIAPERGPSDAIRTSVLLRNRSAQTAG